MEKLKERTEYIDIFRGIGIFLMIACHVYFGYAFDKFVHAFHMPMFFFVTGYFFKITETKKFMIKKFKTLIIPYVFFGTWGLVVYSLLNGEFFKEAFGHLLWINTQGLMDVGAVWFLTSLFWALIIYFMINKLIDSQPVIHVTVIAIAILGNISYDVLPYRLPWAIEAAFVAVGFIHLGYIIHKNAENRLVNRILHLKIGEILLLMIVTVFLIYVNGYVNMRRGEYSNIILFWLNALMAIIVIWNISEILFIRCSRITGMDKILNCIKIMGRDSITFLCMNQMVICTLTTIIPDFNIYIQKIYILILTIMILFALNKILTNTKLRILLGK